MMKPTHFFWLLVVTVALALGCASKEDPRGTRVAVRGNVTLDGQPLSRARIFFRSKSKPNAVTATGSIVDGSFEIPAERGPLTGDMRVEIEPETVDLAEFEAQREHSRRRVAFTTARIPARYNSQSELSATVSLIEAENVFNFELKSR